MPNETEVGDLVVVIRATAENIEQVVEQVKERLQGIGTASEKTKKPLEESGQAGKKSGEQIAAGAKEAQLAWLALSVVAVMVFKQIGSAINQGIKDANAYKDALRGLGSVAEATGVSSDAMEQATEKVVDQFFNATAAATAFKNLLLRGFTLDQATATILRLKDAAAFGRQASLSLSQAVTSATEGLKNENSILVDNAGVTKNVAMMWKDYAQSIGIVVDSLTKAQKVEAEYQGIMKETAAMQGDIIKLQEQLSGKMAAAENQAYLLSKAYGEAMTPLVAAGTELKTGFLAVLTEIVETMPGLAAGATTSTTAFLGMLIIIPGITKIIGLVKTLKIALAAMNLSLGPIGWIAAGIGLLIGVYTAVAASIENARIEEEKRVQANREAVVAEQERAASLRDTLNTYVELSKKQSLSYTEAYNLVSIEADLAKNYGITKEALDKLVNSTDDYAASLNGVVNAATGADALAALEQRAADSLAIAQKSMGNLENLSKYTVVSPETGDHFTPLGSQISADDFKGQSEKAFADINQWIADELAIIKENTTQQGKDFSDEMSQIITSALIPQVDLLSFDSADDIQAFFENMISSLGDIAADDISIGALEGLQGITEKLMSGVVPSDEEIVAAQEAWSDLLGVDSEIYQYLEALAEAGDLTEEQFTDTMAALAKAADPLSVIGSGFDDTKARMEDFAASAGHTADEIADAEKELETFKKTLVSTNREIGSTSAMTNNLKQWRDLYKAYKDAIAGGKDVSAVLKDMTPLAKKVTAGFDGSEQAIEAANDAFERMATYLPQRAVELETQIASLEQQLWELEAVDPTVIMDADPTALVAAIALAKQELAETIALMEALGLVLSQSRGGGGGKKSTPSTGSGPSKTEYDLAIEKMEHLKALDQLTYEQELANLEDIARRIQMSKEEQLDLEECIYDAKKRIAERDAENLTDLTDALMDALSERYAKMREAEMEALDQSQEAWEEWRDHNVSAIEDQIDALDALEEAEDRQQTKDEHLRKIAQLEQSLAYEQDEYNKLQLRKQLDAARKAYDDWLREMDRKDQRTALQQQIENINHQADSEIDALDDRRAELEAFYRDRMSQANLQAEAEVELMNSTQQQIIDLLADYAPEYDAMGRTLGERLMDGFVSTVGVFDDWFATFSQNLADALAQIQAANVAAANNRSQSAPGESGGASERSVNINQQNNFNTPVESPAETARRIRRANEDLAEQIMGG